MATDKTKSPQDKVRELLDSAEERENLNKWVLGYIPKHYKRISCDMGTALELAKLGVTESLTLFDTPLFFTQSLILGASICGRYRKISIVTTSQYGKSFTSGIIALCLANRNEPCYVAGGEQATTDMIMNNVLSHLQNADDEIKNKILDYRNKIEKLQTSVTKEKLTFKGGGLIEAITLGASTNDAKKGNKAIGRGGNYILDEAALVPDDVVAELGRSEFASIDEKKYLLMKISNPHQKGHFYDDIMSDSVKDDELVIWMDVRTAYEENRIRTKEQVYNSDFFKNDSTCQRYLVCDVENGDGDSMFTSANIDDSEIEYGYTYFLGVDSAYKGKDSLDLCLSAVTPYGKMRILDIISVDKGGEWRDGVTSERILDQITDVIRKFHVRFVCVDIGWGVYLVEGLAKRSMESMDFTVLGINFGGSTTKERSKANHSASKYGYNMRAELHIDLQELMNSGNISFTTKCIKILSKQLLAVRTEMKTNGKKAIISKDIIKQEIGHSPDELDSCLLSVHAAILYNMSGSGITIYSDNQNA